MDETRKIAIEGKDLVMQYGDKFALENVNIQIYEGEFLSLLGPSGCGKTTLLKLLAGLDTPTAGTVYLDDKDVTQIPAYGRPSNMVFQQLALFPHMDVWHNVAYGLKVKKEKKEVIKKKVNDILNLVQLTEYADHMISELSGGQAQRVAIARALVNQPKVLFLDEPLSALDQKLRLTMQQELRKIQRKTGATFVFVTHDQQEAISISDRIAVMNDGKLQQIGPVPEIYENPANGFVAEFIGDTNFLPVTFERFEGEYAYSVFKGKISFKSRYSKTVNLDLKDQIKVSVRCQYVNVTKEQEQVTNSLHGTVEEINYGGTNYSYLVRTDDGSRMQCVCPIHLNKQYFKPGDPVFLSWDVENSILLTQE